MQCLQLTRGDPPAAPLKWYFNQTITLPKIGTTWTIDFVLGSSTKRYYKLKVINNVDKVSTLRGSYFVSMGDQHISTDVDLYTLDGGWGNGTYRTITFATPPTGTLLSWLKDNAVPK